MQKKLRAFSQYYPDLEYLTPDVTHHSQIGDRYTLAKLGCVDELYDRLAKYDIDDTPLNWACANHAIDYFMNQIPNCGVIPFDEAFDAMDKSKSIGFGAAKEKIFSRDDPNMRVYMKEYLKLTLDRTHNVIINASQKDEVRVADKTARLFTSYPPEHTLMATIVLGDFLRQFVNNRFCVNGSVSTVGDSIQAGAGRVYFTELSKRPFLYCTDTKAQDSSVNPKFIEAVYSAINKKYQYTHDEQKWFNAVKHNSINKMINVNGHLYLVPRGLGSGDYLTIIINIMWRLFMFLDSYNHPLERVFLDNTIIICGDDFACSSEYDDLDMDSRYAVIEWEKRPLSWEEMDFCSIRFTPDVHHDPVKVRSVLDLRKKRVHQLSPSLEMQRLGGLLRVHADRETYNLILSRMKKLLDRVPELKSDFDNMYVSYSKVARSYNDFIEFHGVLKSCGSPYKMSKTFSKQKQPVKQNNNNSAQKKKVKVKRRNKGFEGSGTRQTPFSSKTGNQNSGNKKMERKRIVFNETLGAVTSSIDFQTKTYSWNPGVAATFPWLSKEAAQWEKYVFMQSKIVYIPQVTEFSPNGVGSLVMSFDSNASDGPPNGLLQALDTQPRSYDLPCKQIILNIPPKIMNTHTDGFYIRRGNNPPNTDIKTYDCGNLFVSTVGQASLGGVLGILSVQYTVDFMIPVLENDEIPTPNTRMSSYQCPLTLVDYGTAYPVPSVVVTNGLNLDWVGGYLTPAAGNYLMFYSVAVSSGNETDEGLTDLQCYVHINDVAYQLEGQVIYKADNTEPNYNSPGWLSGSSHISLVTDGTKKISFVVYVEKDVEQIGTQFGYTLQATLIYI